MATPGVYPDIPFDEYLKLDALNASTLKRFDESPRHALHYVSEPDPPPGPHLVFGSFLHSMVLEPDTVDALYGVKPTVNRSTKEGVADYHQWLTDEVGGDWSTIDRDELLTFNIRELREDIAELEPLLDKTYLTAEEFDQARLMAAQVNETTLFEFRKDRQTELTVVAPIAGTMCKIRIDLYSPLGVLIDLKSTSQSARVESFSNEIVRYRYDVQAGLYAAVARAAGLDVAAFAFVPVSKTPPYLASFLAIDDLDILEDYATQLVIEFSRWLDYNEWPGYYDGGQSVSVPGWRKQQMEERIP